MKTVDKDKVISKFKNKQADILVSTPVIEVGIDIPSATIMLIEAAERFGLAQLHQLRGRVGRGKTQSYCLLFTNAQSEGTIDRLKNLEKYHNGAQLAQKDLQSRGPGEILGTMQHGFWELKAANWQDIELIKTTRKLAQQIIESPENFPNLLQIVNQKSRQ